MSWASGETQSCGLLVEHPLRNDSATTKLVDIPASDPVQITMSSMVRQFVQRLILLQVESGVAKLYCCFGYVHVVGADGATSICCRT